MQPYEHIPLKGSRPTRVLELQPSIDTSTPIRCSLKAISLDDYPQWQAPYTALSYTWDNQEPSREVDCDARCLLVTPNCDAAIRALRDMAEVRILWIDSICIDQSEAALDERSRHVALMGEIYKSAARVVVWLGEENAPVQSAINKMMEITTRIEPTMERRAVQHALRDHARKISESVKNPSDDPIGPLFECSWFERMWTVQEVSLAFVERIVLRCGTLEVPWPAIVIALDALKTSQYKWGKWRAATSLQKQLVTYLLVRRYPGARGILDDNAGNIHNDPIVFDILTNARKKQSGNPKDKVLALYGLFKELDIPLAKPDYSLSVEDIYREATITSIEYDKNLYTLYHAPSDRRRLDLASWVPDWSEPGFDPDDSRYALLRDRFAASGPGVHIWSFSSDRKGLILRGKIIDTVIYKADPMPDLGDFASLTSGERTQEQIVARKDEHMQIIHDAVTIFKSWVKVSQWADYPTGESSRNAFQRTLVADNPENNAMAITDNNFNIWYDNLGLDELDLLENNLKKISIDSQLPSQPNQRREFLTKMKDQVSDQTSNFMAFGSNRFHSIAFVYCQKRCFFYTENEYFGTAPDPLPMSMEVGDKIVLISGLEMPLMLRPVEGGYRLITHVYLHGAMYSELWPEDRSGLEDIVLL